MNWFSRFMHTGHRLGLRIIKTGIAATVCVVLSELLKLNQPLITVIAAVMSMGKSIDISLKAGKNKMIGVLMGAALGGLCAMLLPGNAGLCGVGVILLLYLCHLFRLEGAGALSCFTFAYIMFAGSSAKPLSYALTCAENALIGIAVAVIVNLAVLPPNYAQEVKNIYRLLCEKTAVAVEAAAARRTVDIKELESAIERLEQNVRLYVSEAKMLRGSDEEVFAISCKVTSYRAVVNELRILNEMKLKPEDRPPENIQTVFDYHTDHVRRLFDGIAENTHPEAGD